MLYLVFTGGTATAPPLALRSPWLPDTFIHVIYLDIFRSYLLLAFPRGLHSFRPSRSRRRPPLRQPTRGRSLVAVVLKLHRGDPSLVHASKQFLVVLGVGRRRRPQRLARRRASGRPRLPSRHGRLHRSSGASRVGFGGGQDVLDGPFVGLRVALEPARLAEKVSVQRVLLGLLGGFGEGGSLGGRRRRHRLRGDNDLVRGSAQGREALLELGLLALRIDLCCVSAIFMWSAALRVVCVAGGWLVGVKRGNHVDRGVWDGKGMHVLLCGQAWRKGPERRL